MTARWQFLLQQLDLPAATGVDTARWEHFQYAHLNDDGTFRIENKSRQIAWSWLASAEGIAEAVLYGTSSAYVSINQDEAAEKIRYAKSVYYAIRGIRLPKLTHDSMLALEFDNGARLLSLPARPPRGKSRFNIYLDEFAHVMYDREIYTAALPIISKGGRLRVGSSPMGASGVFWELYSEAMRRYPGYVRKASPWWEVYALCTNAREARKLAPGMPTAERVARYGTERLQVIYDNMPEDDFRQEYECEFVDEATAWITWEEIRNIQDAELDCLMVSGVDAAMNAISTLQNWVPRGKTELAHVAGVDVGRTRNTTEIYVIGLSREGSFPLRLAITLDNVDFDGQYAVMDRLLRAIPIVSMWIDMNGIGRNLAENLEGRFPGKAKGMTFTNATKALWSSDVKMLVQQHKARIPTDRDLAYQIHSIKRKVTAARNTVFDTDTNEKHHADRYWAWALALSAAKILSGGSGMTVQEY
ncbi:MAG: terminase family protein [Gammaproteobacteria bacterium]|nr:terminase family protein [Gammaproteobacteria bacterium]